MRDKHDADISALDGVGVDHSDVCTVHSVVSWSLDCYKFVSGMECKISDFSHLLVASGYKSMG